MPPNGNATNRSPAGGQSAEGNQSHRYSREADELGFAQATMTREHCVSWGRSVAPHCTASVPSEKLGITTKLARRGNRSAPRPVNSTTSAATEVERSIEHRNEDRRSSMGLWPSLLYTSLSCSLPSGLSRRERQLAGYTRTLRNTFPEHLRLSVGPVPAGARLASYVCQLNRGSRRDRPGGERDILPAFVANQL